MQLTRSLLRILLIPFGIFIGLPLNAQSHIPVYPDLSPQEVLERKLKTITITGRAWYDFGGAAERGYQDLNEVYEFDDKGRLIREVRTGEPGSQRRTTLRHLYAGESLKQTEVRGGPDGLQYTYYTYDDEDRLTRIESKAANIAISYPDSGGREVETLNHKHDYPALREEKFDSLDRLLVRRDYRKHRGKQPILFKITHYFYDSLTHRLIATEDSILRSVKDPDSWNLEGMEYGYDDQGRLNRETHSIVLFGSTYQDEKTITYGVDGLIQSSHCSPPGFPPCKENYEGELEDSQGRIALTFSGGPESAELSRLTWTEDGLLATRVVEAGKLLVEEGLDQMPPDPEEEIWEGKRIVREEAYEYEFFE